MDKAQTQRLISIAQKVAIFQGLTTGEVMTLLQVCRPERYDEGETVYRCGDAADEMFLLVSGTLSVLTPDGTELWEAKSGMSIGEMGLFTGEPRSADIVTKQAVTGFKIRKMEFDALLKIEQGIFLKVLQNVVRMMAERLRETNSRLDRSGDTIERLMTKMEDLIGEPRDAGN